MKSYIQGALAAGTLLLSLSAQATVINFSQAGHPDFTTTSVNYTNGAAQTTSGYRAISDATGNQYVAFNPSAAPSSSFNWANAGTFDLTGFAIAGAWGSQTLTIEGYNGSNLMNSLDFDVTTQASDFIANWSDLTSFVINIGTNFVDNPNINNGSGQHWAMNSLVINENVSVPAPASILLLGLALVGAGFSRKRK